MATIIPGSYLNYCNAIDQYGGFYPVISRTDVSVVAAPSDGDNYLQSINAGGFSQDFLYAFSSQSNAWIEYDPSPNSGMFIYDTLNAQVYQVSRSGVVTSMDLPRYILATLSDTNAVPKALVAATPTILDGFAGNVLAGVGSFSGNTFTPSGSGIYSITIRSTAVAASVMSLQIYNAVIPMELSDSTNYAVGANVACNWTGYIAQGQGIQFAGVSSNNGNVTYNVIVSRLA